MAMDRVVADGLVAKATLLPTKEVDGAKAVALATSSARRVATMDLYMILLVGWLVWMIVRIQAE